MKPNQMEKRRRECATCKSVFYPRTAQINKGQGKYCSRRCGTIPRVHGMSAKGLAVRNRRIAEGITKFPIGPANKQWKGGPVAARARAIADGRLAKRVAKYRAENPHKTREWYNNRRGRKSGRLPKGYIAALFLKQRGKCAVCAVDLRNDYHTDHIIPLSGGGKHRKGNIQLLCPHCNCTKSAKDPIQYMQERGFLI